MRQCDQYSFDMFSGNPYVKVNVSDLVPGDIVHLHAGEGLALLCVPQGCMGLKRSQCLCGDPQGMWCRVI